ncbi:hypothetical protein [Pseudomonas nitroreducens]|uniref:hypothetical protein n=1 Tax=Pseudomonas nitroreducens TaxID=46680 RepID=UPI003D2AA0A4
MSVGMLYLTSQSSGAPPLAGQNGSLCAVLDWALAQKGWTTEYTGANARVYRPPAGNRFRLYVAHDSAISGDARLATTRGCENASSVTSLTDPFPTVAQYANSQATFLVSTTASAVARDYRIIVTDRMVLMFVNCAGQNNQNWDMMVFGDVLGADAADVFGTIMHVGGVTTATAANSRAMSNALCSIPAAPGRTFWARSIDGTQKSTYGCYAGQANNATVTTFCSNGASAPVMRGGYNGRIVREKVGVHCIGSNTTTPNTLAVNKRGWVPNIWNPLHSGIGVVTSDDTFTDTGYSPSAVFNIAPAGTAVAVIIETTDTWSLPSG